MFQAVFFDLGGVLFSDGTKRFIAQLAFKNNLPMGKTVEIFDADLGTLYREGKIGRDDFWQRVITELDLKERIDDLESQWNSCYELNSQVKEIVLSLKKTIKVFYISGNVKERVDHLNQKFGFLSWFDGGVFSYEAGARKPKTEIFMAGMEKAGVTAEQSIMVDDKLRYLIPALQLGMTTILFESAAKLKTKLKEFNLLI